MKRWIVVAASMVAVIATHGISTASDQSAGDDHWNGSHNWQSRQGPPGAVGLGLFGLWAVDAQQLKELEPNGDGAISRTALKAFLERRFNEIDTNHDGKLSRSEVEAWFASEKQRREQRAFNRLDENGDGYIERDEFESRALARFDRIDINHDGVLSPEELSAAREAMQKRWHEHREDREAP
jgi:EF-hand domain pair